VFTELISFEHIMGKEAYILRVVESMQATVDKLSEEVLIAINREEMILKEEAFNTHIFNACLMGIDFVYINVCISALAALKTDNVHAKRYHWKNVVAGIAEGIKYIYSFKEGEKKTLIGYLTTILNDSGMVTPEISDSLSVLQDLLEKFRADWDGKVMRDIALHYDKSAGKLIKETMAITDEEPYASLLSCYLLIMNILHAICTIGYLQSLIENDLGLSDVNLDETGLLGNDGRHMKAIQALLKGKKFKVSTEKYLNEYGKRFLDSIALFEKIQKGYEFLGIKKGEKSSNGQLEKFYQLNNLYSLVMYSMLDILSITDSYLSSDTEFEAALNMRYFLIVKTSALTQIVGYTEEEARESLWYEMKQLLPESDVPLHDMADKLESCLKESVQDQNVRMVRAKLVHLKFFKKKPGDVKGILSILNTFDPLTEFYKVMDLIELLIKVIKFLDRLIVSIDKEVTIENQKFLDKIRSMSSSLRDMIERNVKDKAQKEEMLTSINANEFKIIDLLKKRL
jgi:hypothetical protein